MLGYRSAVQARNWPAAERCLASDLRHTLKHALADRTFFDQHMEKGGRELVHVHHLNEKWIMSHPLDLHFKAKPIGFVLEAEVGGDMGPSIKPFYAIQHFVREKDGWKLACLGIKAREDFQKWYDRVVHRRLKGQARKEEQKQAEQPPERDK